jgi:SAM-dependent methyltransferase
VSRQPAAAAVLLLALAGCGLRQHFPGPDVLFVATPAAVGTAMLRAAAVTADDVVFDLGSGDGRLVIAAARDFGARGVGVEIDASLVKDSRDAARAAGVADRVTFLWQDLFATDLASATVVTLYLRDDVNRKLRPKLLGELSPGTRVVSHDFDMGDWLPDRVQRVRGPSREHRLYVWIVPAVVAGAWQTRLGDDDAVLTLTQHYQVVDGTLARAGRRLPVSEGRLEGDRLDVAVGPLRLSGRVQGDVVTGTAREGPDATPRSWSARRIH